MAEELRDFIAENEKAPKAMLYPRDPSLDPQLVWKRKDEQDQASLEVPVVPIYIQEKVHPQALVGNLRDTAKVGESEPELTLFSDFNGIGESDFAKKVDFYHHDQHWSNRMILGDSLLVMTSLSGFRQRANTPTRTASRGVSPCQSVRNTARSVRSR